MFTRFLFIEYSLIPPVQSRWTRLARMTMLGRRGRAAWADPSSPCGRWAWLWSRPDSEEINKTEKTLNNTLAEFLQTYSDSKSQLVKGFTIVERMKRFRFEKDSKDSLCTIDFVQLRFAVWTSREGVPWFRLWKDSKIRLVKRFKDFSCEMSQIQKGFR